MRVSNMLSIALTEDCWKPLGVERASESLV